MDLTLQPKSLLILVLFSLVTQVVLADTTYLYGSVGIGLHNRSWDSPEIVTHNALGNIQVGIGRELGNDLDIRLGMEHWSSLQGFPKVFDSPDEDGYGFNGIWLKLEKKFYF